MYLTNVSLNYIHYILRVVFKSSRLLPVMVRMHIRNKHVLDYFSGIPPSCKLH